MGIRNKSNSMKRTFLSLSFALFAYSSFSQVRAIIDPSIGLTSRNLNFTGNLDAGIGWKAVAFNASVMGIVESHPQYGFFASVNMGSEHHLITLFGGTNWAARYFPDKESQTDVIEVKWRPMGGIRYNNYKGFVELRYTTYDWRLCMGFSIFKPRNEGVAAYPRG